MKKSHYLGIILGVAFIVAMSWLVFREKPVDIVIDSYEKIETQVHCVKITERAEVRSEPRIIQEPEGRSNSFGKISEANFTVEVSLVYKTDEVLDDNGAYYGLLVDEILATTEGEKWFPQSMSDDPDGIIWLNAKYVEIIA